MMLGLLPPVAIPDWLEWGGGSASLCLAGEAKGRKRGELKKATGDSRRDSAKRDVVDIIVGCHVAHRTGEFISFLTDEILSFFSHPGVLQFPFLVNFF